MQRNPLFSLLEVITFYRCWPLVSPTKRNVIYLSMVLKTFLVGQFLLQKCDLKGSKTKSHFCKWEKWNNVFYDLMPSKWSWIAYIFIATPIFQDKLQTITLYFHASCGLGINAKKKLLLLLWKIVVLCMYRVAEKWNCFPFFQIV